VGRTPVYESADDSTGKAPSYLEPSSSDDETAFTSSSVQYAVSSVLTSLL